ncbi:MAG TPA: SDR family oxidoreductase [Solirubrobacteraceae bacterium]|nr:SDR family oxidoreductase [Solirubrobacteraceae bacterium]
MTADRRVVVVTRGESERSLAIARAFEQEGAQVVLVARAAVDAPPGVELRILGATDLETCRRLVADIVSERGRIDVWVNGFVAPEPGEALAVDQPSHVVSAAIEDTLHGCLAAAPPMIARGEGVILNLSTVLATHHEGEHALESAASGGVRSLTHALGVEWAPRGVRVVGVAWGAAASTGASLQRVPLQRDLTNRDLAEAASYLCGPGGSFVIAETLVVDGGLTTYQMF